jgi:hypothetical protein
MAPNGQSPLPAIRWWKKTLLEKSRLRQRLRQPFRFASLTTIELKGGGRVPEIQTIPIPTSNSEFWILNPLIGPPSHARAAVPQHCCRGGCSSEKVNSFSFLDEHPHRHSPMSILIPLFSAALRLCARPKPRPLRARSKLPFDTPKSR